MKKRKLYIYTLLSGLVFIVVIVVVALLYRQVTNLYRKRSASARASYNHYVENLNLGNLAGMTEFIEKRYPVLHDTALLKQEAGADWFWEIADEWYDIAVTLNFAYIAYIEKTDGYSFLLSSGIRRYEHPNWLGGPVWTGETPAYIDEAWKTKQLTYSPEPIVTEWGTLISAARPIVNNGKTAGILAINYRLSHMDSLTEHELYLQKQESALLRRTRNTVIVFLVAIILAMCFQISLSYNSVVMSVKDMEEGEHTFTMLDAAPMMCSLWDARGHILNCNIAALRLFGFTQKPEFLDRFFKLNPEYQPDGERSGEKLLRLIDEVLKNGYQQLEWMMHTREGEPLPIEATLVRVLWDDDFCVAFYGRDLRENNNAGSDGLKTENA